LANNDGFGIATVQKLYAGQIRNVSDVYQLKRNELTAMGFGDKTSQNLIHQLKRSRHESIDDWRFLAAFGVSRLGQGNCENLLKHCVLEQVFDLTVDDISNMDGFAVLTAQLIVDGLSDIQKEFNALMNLGFNLESTILISDSSNSSHPLYNKKIVFTGKMSQPRSDLQKQAKSLGIKVSGSVNSKTDYLVIGDKVGATKLNAAKKQGVVILQEADYLSRI